MAKRSKTENRDEGKTGFELRFDPDVYDGIKRLADGASISVNQLMQGLARWAVQRGHQGEPKYGDHQVGIIGSREQPGCLWFGNVGFNEDVFNPDTQDIEPQWVPGEVYCRLDFTERRVVREYDPRPTIVKKVGKK